MVGSVFEVRVMEHSKSFGRRHEVDDGEEGLVDITRAKGSGKGGMEVAEEMEEVEEVGGERRTRRRRRLRRLHPPQSP